MEIAIVARNCWHLETLVKVATKFACYHLDIYMLSALQAYFFIKDEVLGATGVRDSTTSGSSAEVDPKVLSLWNCSRVDILILPIIAQWTE